MSPKRKRRKTDDDIAAFGDDTWDERDGSDSLGHQLLHAGKSKDLLIKLLKVGSAAHLQNLRLQL